MPSTPAVAEERLRAAAAEILALMEPQLRCMVTEVILIAGVVLEDGTPSALQANTAPRNPWLRIGLLQAELVRAQRQILESTVEEGEG